MKRFCASRRRTSHQFVEEWLLFAVDVAEEGEIERKGADRQTVDAQVSDGFVVEDTKRAKCSVSNCANGTSGLFGLTHPGSSFMESSKPRSSVSRDGTIGAKIMKVRLRSHGLLVEYLITCGLVMRHLIHVMP